MSKAEKKDATEQKVDEKLCFVISPIGPAESEIRKRADTVLKYIIRPVAADAGYRAVRADEISEQGMITKQVIQRIIEAPLVIADLTGQNPNVFYELAIRHAVRKPFIQLIKKGEPLPFDVSNARTVYFDVTDLDNVEQAKTELGKLIRSGEKIKEGVDTPISEAVEIKSLKESGNPEERTLGELVEAVSNIRAGLTSIEKKIGSPEKLLPPDYLDFALRNTRAISRSVIPREFYFDMRDISERLVAIASKPKIDNKEIMFISDRIRELAYRIERNLEDHSIIR